jgi:NAD(P)-dependent dehydrogenase (short-subunit alcohol dehydrogenase family)
MDISGSVALVIAAHGGIGRAFVADMPKRGVAKIYVTARDTASLANAQPTRRNLRGCRNQMTEHDATSDPQAFGQE